MNADLTFNTIVFKKQYDNEAGSRRQSNARGVNTVDAMTIKSQPYTDSATKVDGKRFTARIDRDDIDASLQLIQSSAYFVITVPKTATQAQIDNVVATFKAVVADANFVVNVLNGER